MNLELDFDRRPHIDALHEIGERIAAADPLHTVMKLVVDFVSAVVKSDSCFVYVVDEAPHGAGNYRLGGGA
jgi:hypothetical protein